MTKYYCLKCEKYHYRGKIYNNHLQFKREQNYNEKKDLTNIEELEFESLRPIAKRQILLLIRKMENSKMPEFYKKQITRVIVYENKND